MPPRRRRHGLELGLVLLFNELLQFGMRSIPPVTLGTILGQVIFRYKIFLIQNKFIFDSFILTCLFLQVLSYL